MYRNFHLKLVPDSSAFHEDFVMVDELDNVIEHDLSHLYSGNLHGLLMFAVIVDFKS